jgi:hypothetical protein
MNVPAKKKQADTTVAITPLEVDTGRLECEILGSSALVCNRMSEKARRELLLPALKKTPTQKESTLKHDPLEEYRASPYTVKEDDAPTAIALPGSAFKRAIASAAVDQGGKRAQVARLCWVPDTYVPIYGVPQLYMAVTRQAGIVRTPDIRTRAILPRWACRLHVEFVQPILKPQIVVNLLLAAGIYIGVGDGRPEKGALTFGRFRVLRMNDAAKEEFDYLLTHGGRAVQVEALRDPAPYDDETAEMLEWFAATARKRDFKIVG